MHQLDAAAAFFSEATLSREEVDRFLDPDVPAWAKFDSELGYLPNDCFVPDNFDGALSEYRYGPLGERLLINHASRHCRINTYGDSFTQCHQVSDGQTWQEGLAAHFGEPIRNFGVGGFGVYQAVRRLYRVEQTDGAAPFVILNIYLDDHYRNIDAYRLLRLGRWWRDYDQSLSTSMFHANPWQHVRLDSSNGRIVECSNVCPTPESLYSLCDTEFLLETFGDDFVAHKLIGDQYDSYHYLDQYEDLARALSIDFQPRTAPAETAHNLWEQAAFSATEQIVTRLQSELDGAGKKLIVLLTYPADAVSTYLAHGVRPDQRIVDALSRLNIEFVDGLGLHADDFRNFSVPPEAYVQRYYAGHYTPLGNATFAYLVKERIVEWLEPKPPNYSNSAASFAKQAGRLA
jgi:hypothetical protein